MIEQDPPARDVTPRDRPDAPAGQDAPHANEGGDPDRDRAQHAAGQRPAAPDKG